MARITKIWRHMRAQWGTGRTARGEDRAALAKCVLERLEPRVLLSADATAAANESLINGPDAPSVLLGEAGIEVDVNPADLSGCTLQQTTATSGQAAEPDFLKLPLAFEANEGQTDSVVDFVAHGSGYSVFLTGGDAVLRLDRGDAWYVVRIDLLGALAHPEVAGLDVLPGRSNYFLGSDPEQWYTDIANYGSVEYTGVYDGVDVRYYGNQRQLEYDFRIAAGADPNVIRLAFPGVESVYVDESGGLVLQLSASGEEIRFRAPVSYQQTDEGHREMVASRYVVTADGVVGFEVGPYDTSRPLVIDPALDYGTYLGGTGNERGQIIRVDDTGNIYIAGRTSSVDFPVTTGAVDPTYHGNSDVFVAQLSPDGSSLAYSTFIGGSASDQAFDIQVMSSGVVYVTGETMSSDFPTSSGAYDSTLGGPSDGFVAKFNPAKGNLIYSTFVGGAQNDACFAIAVDSGGRAYVTGTTESSDFPLTAGAFQSSLNGSSDIFIVGFGPSGVQLDYGTYLGGSGTAVERGNGMAIDNAGHLYLTGSTGAGDFPTTPGAYDGTFNGGDDAFFVEFDPAAGSLVYSTYLGGSGDDEGNGIFRDGSGNVYLVGDTASVAFPTTLGAYDQTHNGATDAFVAKFDAAYLLAYSTYFGGADIDHGNDIAVDATGQAHIVGQTYSGDLPTTTDAHQSALRGSADAYVAILDAAGATPVYSTYLGGAGLDAGLSITLDSAANIYVTGYAGAGGFDITAGAYDTTYNGGEDAFVARFTAGGSPAHAPRVDLDADDSSGQVGADFTTIFREGLGPVVIADIDALVSDLDSINLVRLTVAITNLRDAAAESLSANTTGTNITASYDSNSGVLTLSGLDTLAHYQQVLRTIRYNNTSANPDATPRVIQFVANDGARDSNVATTTVTIVPQDNAPYVDLDADDSSGQAGADFTTIFREGLGPVTIADIDALVSDVDSVNLVRLTVTIMNLRDGAAESLSANTAGTNIVASYNTGTGVLTLSGLDTVAHYQQVLRTIRYNNTSANPDTTPRVVRLVANDGSSDSNIATATVAVVAQGNVPHVDLDADDSSGQAGADFTTIFREGLGPVTIADIDALVSDFDSTDLVRLTVTITNLRDGAAESLSANTAGTSIVAGYNSATGVLTLSGLDTLAHYQQVLRTIRYDNTSANPDTAPRVIRFVANDGSNDSNAAGATVAVVARNDAPTLADIEGTPLPCTENDPARPVTGSVTVGDVDDTYMESATVRITGNYRYGQDILRFVDTGAITGTWNPTTGTLTLTGSDTLANYQAALCSITYRNTSENPDTSTRTVTFTVNDGAADSDSVVRDITISAVNDAPVVSDQVFQAVGWAIPGIVIGTIAVTDPDGHVVDYRITSGNANDYLAVDPATGTITLNHGDGLSGASRTLVLEVEVTDDGTPSLSNTAVMTVIVTFLPEGTVPVEQDEGDPQENADPEDDGDPEDDTTAEDSLDDPSAPSSDLDGNVGPARRPDTAGGTFANGFSPALGSALPGRTPDAYAFKAAQASFTVPVVGVSAVRSVKEPPAATITHYAERLLPQLKNFLGDFRAQITRKSQVQNVRIGVTAALAGTISVGYVIWLLRGGVLLTAVLSSLPAWRYVDPLPVLDAWATRRKREEQERKDEDETERRVQSIFE